MTRVALLVLLTALAHSQYTEHLGSNLCRLAVAAYCKKAAVESWTCEPCLKSPIVMTNVKTFENSSMDTLGFIGTSNELDAIILVFRGTLPWDIKNWISDINFIATAYPPCNNNCKVHRGFYLAYMEIHKQVTDTVALYRKMHPKTNLIVTGHSLGAALATHAAAHLMASRIPVNALYTFGSPRIGDKKFTLWFNDIYGGASHFKARVTHGKDPVPHLPLEDWGFLHLSTQIFYKGTLSEKYVTCNDQSAEDKNCSDKYLTDANVLDHVTYYDIDFSGIVLLCQ